MGEKIAEYEPVVENYYQTLLLKEELIGHIDQLRKKTQDKVKQLWENS